MVKFDKERALNLVNLLASVRVGRGPLYHTRAKPELIRRAGQLAKDAGATDHEQYNAVLDGANGRNRDGSETPERYHGPGY